LKARPENGVVSSSTKVYNKKGTGTMGGGGKMGGGGDGSFKIGPSTAK
jgi:hypothetical protein